MEVEHELMVTVVVITYGVVVAIGVGDVVTIAADDVVTTGADDLCKLPSTDAVKSISQSYIFLTCMVPYRYLECHIYTSRHCTHAFHHKCINLLNARLAIVTLRTGTECRDIC